MYAEKKTIYDMVYILVKSLILIIITTLVLQLTFGLTFVSINKIFANFIAEDYRYTRKLFTNINLKNIVADIGLSLGIYIVLISFLLNGLLINGITSSVLRGLNLIILIQLIASLLYLPFYTQNNLTPMKVFKESILLVNYKIGLTLIAVIGLYLALKFLILVLGAYLLIFGTVIIFLWQLLGSFLITKINEEIRRKNEGVLAKKK